MTDDPLDRLQAALKRATPDPDAAARDRALRAAAQKFAAVTQGSTEAARPIQDRPRGAGFWTGVKTMISHITGPRVLMGTSALATIAIAVALTSQFQLGDRVAGSGGYVPEPKSETAEIDGLATLGRLDGTRELRQAPTFADDADTLASGPAGAEQFRTQQETEARLGEVAQTGADTVSRDRAEVAATEAEEMPLAAAPPARLRENAASVESSVVGGLADERAARSAVIAPPVPQPMEPPAVIAESSTEQYPQASPNPLKLTADEPVSTFSIDVDTASYAVMRSSLQSGQLPPREAVRIEELVNYFDYAYPAPTDAETPFATSVSVAPTPWNPDTRLLHIGIQGYDLPADDRPPLNLVFLIDTSGSMNDPAKLPLLVRSFKLLLDTLRPEDSVAIVTYAGSAGMALAPTPAEDRVAILSSLDRLAAGGSTAGQAGLQQAYALAEQMAEDGEVTRVILATDGDFNVGISNPEALKDFVAEKRETGVYLSVLGFARGNYNDAIMQSLAQNGNGFAAYIDTLAEAQKVLVEDVTGALFPIAGDVKIQIEFNPATVSEYRLIGYETRALNREDFNDDTVDAGEIGAGHTVTALYEITPKGSPAERISDLRYGEAEAEPVRDVSDEYAFLKLRYKLPGEDRSRLIETPVLPDRQDIAPDETRFAAAVAGFGMLLRGGSELVGWSYDDARELAASARGGDPYGYRSELVSLIRIAGALD